MKVQLTMTVEVDQHAWAREYGIEDGAAAVRKDVRQYFAEFPQEQIDQLGLAAERRTDTAASAR